MKKKATVKTKTTSAKPKTARPAKLKQDAERSGAKPKTAKQIAANKANQTTWLLKGTLKNAQLSVIRVGKLLTLVRDEKMWQTLGHPDMEDYAEKRLQLGRASLYRYMQTYDWVLKNHPAWAAPKPQGFIPELNDIVDLMTIETELAKKDLTDKTKTVLEELKIKALSGNLKKGEVAKLRAQRKTIKDSLATFTSSLRNLRYKGAKLATMPPEVITHLDAAIEILKNEKAVAHLILVPSQTRTSAIA